jgi:serine/threonine protein phosphatase PrpC
MYRKLKGERMLIFKKKQKNNDKNLLKEDFDAHEAETVLLTEKIHINKTKFMSAVHSDVGIRKKINQDSSCLKIADTSLGEIALAVVCDGMGGLKKGELASATVIRAFSEWFETELPKLIGKDYSNVKVKEQWLKLIEEQNEMISEYGNNNNLQLGTTLTAMLINGEETLIVQVGDSRVYRITDQIIQLTEDQTVAQRDIKLGILKPENVNKDSRQNILLQCIGASSVVHPKYVEEKVNRGDVYMLCSDGFRHEISNEEFLELLSSKLLNNEAIMKKSLLKLVELNKKREEKDNITAMLVKVI